MGRDMLAVPGVSGDVTVLPDAACSMLMKVTMKGVAMRVTQGDDLPTCCDGD